MHYSCTIVVGIAMISSSAIAFSPLASLPVRTRTYSSCSITMQHSGKRIDRVDGFGGGFEAIQKVIDQRSKDDWGGGQGTGGASGKISDGPASFEEVSFSKVQLFFSI